MKFFAFLNRRLCKLCEQHEAKFMFRGRVKRDRQHDICLRCFQSLCDRMAARRLAPAEGSQQIVPFTYSSYFYRQLLHQPCAKKTG